MQVPYFIGGISVSADDPDVAVNTVTTTVVGSGANLVGSSDVGTLEEGESYTLYLYIKAGTENSFSNDGNPFTFGGNGTCYGFTGVVNGINYTSVGAMLGVGEGDSPGLIIKYDFTVGGACSGSSAGSAHTHSFTHGIIVQPTVESDGLEGDICSCGMIQNATPISAFEYALNQYASSMITAAKPGQTITIDFKEWNSFPKSLMEKVAEKSAQNVTFIFKYKVNHEQRMVTIPAGTPVDTSLSWYGYDKMAELYGAY